MAGKRLTPKEASERRASLERHRSAVRSRLLRSNIERAAPGSVTWNINREMILLAGWGRAILLQLAHPSVAAGVHQHSTFRGSLRSSLMRLRSTVGAMLSITFGDTEQMIAAAAGINAIHDRVRGPVHERSSASYSAHDPHLQRWVHATLIDSILRTHELLIGSLTTRERDQYCAQAVIMEPLLGMPPGWLPRTAQELDDVMRESFASGSLAVTATSRALAHALLYPPNWHMLWPAFRAMQLITIGLLPPAIRTAYGFEWREQDARAFVKWVRALRTIHRMLPRFATRWAIAARPREQPVSAAVLNDAKS